MGETPEGITIDWQAGTVRVSSGYSLKVKVGPADGYNMEDAHTSFSYEVPIPAGVTDPATLAATLVELHATIKDGVKLATMNELDVAFTTTGDGIVRPVITVPGIPVASPVPTAPVQPPVEAPVAQEQPVAPVVPVTPAPPVAGGLPTERIGSGAPVVSGTVVADFGFGELVYYDNRPKKAAGQYKPNAADFKSKDSIPQNNNQQHAVWLSFPNGGANHEMVNAATAYGLV